jgi:putative methionine-R-sulfoxide reductase with GAF domain
MNQIEMYSEERVQEALSSYACPLNRDIERFLREQSISFSKSSSARTFLVFTSVIGKLRLVGFFTLAPKSLVIEEFSGITKSLEKKIRWFSDSYHIGSGENEQVVQIVNVILIAHLGKNYCDGANELITGEQLLAIAFAKIVEIQRELGGRFVSVECEETPSLLGFYQNNGFIKLQDRPKPNEDGYFVQLIRTS